jgi:hypothetical protein
MITLLFKYNNQDVVSQTKDLINVLQNLTPGGGGGIVIKGETNTPSLEIVTDNGNIAGPFKFLSVENSGDVDGQLMGKTIRSGQTITLPAILGDTYDTITYDATGTTFTILKVATTVPPEE